MRRLRRGTTLAVAARVTGFRRLGCRWLRHGKAIKRATKPTSRLTRADRGPQVSCRILPTRADGAAVTVRTKSVRVPERLRA